MITLGNRTKLTTEAEKQFVQLGGGDPERTYTTEELGDRLSNAIEALPADHPIIQTLSDILLDDETSA